MTSSSSVFLLSSSGVSQLNKCLYRLSLHLHSEKKPRRYPDLSHLSKIFQQIRKEKESLDPRLLFPNQMAFLYVFTQVNIC